MNLACCYPTPIVSLQEFFTLLLQKTQNTANAQGYPLQHSQLEPWASPTCPSKGDPLNELGHITQWSPTQWWTGTGTGRKRFPQYTVEWKHQSASKYIKYATACVREEEKWEAIHVHAYCNKKNHRRITAHRGREQKKWKTQGRECFSPRTF